MSLPLLSIVMVNYNHLRYIREAVASVLEQTYTQWELIIVDDGSTDGSAGIAEEFAAAWPGRVRVFRHENNANRGIAASYELGINLCHGQVIGFLEPDDVWLPQNAELKLRVMREHGVGLAYSDVEFIGDCPSIQLRRRFSLMFRSLPKDVPFKAFLRVMAFNPIPTFSSVFIDAVLCKRFDFAIGQPYVMWLDWFLWLQASTMTRFFFISRPLLRWRLHAHSYCTKAWLQRGTWWMRLFELKYRLMLLAKIVLPFRKVESRLPRPVGAAGEI